MKVSLIALLVFINCYLNYRFVKKAIMEYIILLNQIGMDVKSLSSCYFSGQTEQ